MTIRDRNIHPNAAAKFYAAVTTITSAQLLALNATPQSVVPAPGSGFAVVFDGAIIHKPAGVAYAGIAAGEDLAFKYTGAAGLEVAACETTGFLDQTTKQTRWVAARVVAQAAGAVSDLLVVENAILTLGLLVGEITTGDQPLIVKVFYRTIPMVPDTGALG